MTTAAKTTYVERAWLDHKPSDIFTPNDPRWFDQDFMSEILFDRKMTFVFVAVTPLRDGTDRREEFRVSGLNNCPCEESIGHIGWTMVGHLRDVYENFSCVEPVLVPGS